MTELIHMTVTYSNAVLAAIMPHVSDFAQKLDLPIAQPITETQVLKSTICPYKGRVEASVVLKNHYWFMFDHHGYLASFSAPTNWFSGDEDIVEHTERYTGKSQMTTNEAVTLARDTLLRLGYGPELTRADKPPQIQGPFELQKGAHIPYCRVLWEPIKDAEAEGYSKARVEINTQTKALVGLYLYFARTNSVGSPLKLAIEPETEAEFRQRTKANLFIRTNAPMRSLPPIRRHD